MVPGYYKHYVVMAHNPVFSDLLHCSICNLMTDKRLPTKDETS